MSINWTNLLTLLVPLGIVIKLIVTYLSIKQIVLGVVILLAVGYLVIYIWFKLEIRWNEAFLKISYNDKINEIEGIVNHRHLGVKGDLLASAEALARLTNTNYAYRTRPVIGILVGHDGISASVTLSLACTRLGYNVTVISEKCNESVLRAAFEGEQTSYYFPNPRMRDVPIPVDQYARINLHFVGRKDKDKAKLDLESDMKHKVDMLIGCDRVGPSADGCCYATSGIKLNEKRFVAPLHNLVHHFKHRENDRRKFIAIGDGGNELGMGKVEDKIHEYVKDGKKIGAVANSNGKNLAADHLIAVSDSTWGMYALIAAAALVKAHDSSDLYECRRLVGRVMPTEASERALFVRCFDAGNDGSVGKRELTDEGMRQERSLKCLHEILNVAKKY